MSVDRFWTDADGKAHREVASWQPAAEGDERAVVIPVELRAVSEPGNPEGPAVLASVADPAVELPVLLPNTSALYDLPLREGATLIDFARYVELTEEARTSEAEAAEQVASTLAGEAEERLSERRAAIEAFAQAAGVDPDVAERLIGAL